MRKRRGDVFRHNPCESNLDALQKRVAGGTNFRVSGDGGTVRNLGPFRWGSATPEHFLDRGFCVGQTAYTAGCYFLEVDN